MNASLKQGALTVLLAFTAGLAVAAEPDSTLYTTYNTSPDLTSANWIVCGSTTQTGGCYASGSLGPFGHIGAMLESRPIRDANKVTRQIYVLDVAGGATADLVALYVYTKTDVVTATDDTVTVGLLRKIALPLAGGKNVIASMAANNTHVFVSTNESTQAVILDRRNWKNFTTVGAGDPSAPVAAITADSYGFVTVTFGPPNTSFDVFGPSGEAGEGGGGGQVMLDTANAVIPADLPF